MTTVGNQEKKCQKCQSTDVWILRADILSVEGTRYRLNQGANRRLLQRWLQLRPPSRHA